MQTRSFIGNNMDVGSLFALKNAKGKKKALAGASAREGPSQTAGAAAGPGGSKGAGPSKKKVAGKGTEPPAKKPKTAAPTKQPITDVVVIVDEGHASASTPQEQINQEFFGRERLEAIVPKGASVLEGSLNPSALMSQMLPSADRLALARLDEGPLEAKVLLNAASAFMGLCEHLRKVDQMREAKGAAEGEVALLRKKLAEAEDSLRLATDGMEQRMQAARAEGINEGLARAGEAAAEAARIAADEARAAQEEAVSKAREDAVASFMAEGWKTEDRREWLASVVGASVDEWVGGPGKMWLAERGDSYYQGGEFFTQRLIYRKLAKHFQVAPEEFRPEAYGLPPPPPPPASQMSGSHSPRGKRGQFLKTQRPSGSAALGVKKMKPRARRCPQYPLLEL
ncbi:unnamed protein product [Cuscuta europaea]|uniref:Uncharacterized protein n=2 Tax=Cuscuta europaea TaxID=41803 RepID=A0A9P1EM99_CUSEU|nr:unnamed protein product [Cuscuta europaea]